VIPYLCINLFSSFWRRFNSENKWISSWK